MSDYVVAAGNNVSPELFNSKTQCLDSFSESLYFNAISIRLAHAGLRKNKLLLAWRSSFNLGTAQAHFSNLQNAGFLMGAIKMANCSP